MVLPTESRLFETDLKDQEKGEMGSSPLELRLSLKPTYAPKSIATLLRDQSTNSDESLKLNVLNDYLHKHKEELDRVVRFHSLELLQCKLLLMDAIETLSREIRKVEMSMESAAKQHLLEFLPPKDRSYNEDPKELSGKCSREDNDLMELYIQLSEPSDPSNPFQDKQKAPQNTTLQYQATNQDPIPPWNSEKDPIDPCKGKNRKRPFMPSSSNESLVFKLTENECQKEVSEEAVNVPPKVDGLNLKTDPKTLNYHPKPLTQPILKNKRRSWSPELHMRFVEALNILGGIEVATPKQIKEIMQVDGLTNDQVKSHLQKYRLHNRGRPEPAMQSENHQDYWEPDFCYSDLLWMPSASQSSLPQGEHSSSCENYGGVPGNGGNYMKGGKGRKF